TGLGAAGDVVEVKDGYGRNYLLPRGLATPWTKGGQKQVDALTKGREARAINDIEQAKSVKGRIENMPVKVAAKAGQSGRLFGAVSNGDIAEAVKAAGGPELDKRKIEVRQAVKSLGSYEATVRLHADVAATLKFEVVPA
ncbi:MAG TPA: 50S ribosomal protein L9, partial [Intrasporangium sp.]|nr:50S ribosomal protein L9 [Intrasporangium sp.]